MILLLNILYFAMGPHQPLERAVDSFNYRMRIQKKLLTFKGLSWIAKKKTNHLEKKFDKAQDVSDLDERTEAIVQLSKGFDKGLNGELIKFKSAYDIAQKARKNRWDKESNATEKKKFKELEGDLDKVLSKINKRLMKKVPKNKASSLMKKWTQELAKPRLALERYSGVLHKKYYVPPKKYNKGSGGSGSYGRGGGGSTYSPASSRTSGGKSMGF